MDRRDADETSQDDSLIGTVLEERYRIIERIAAGGMGVVYRGERIELERPVAVKFLHQSFVSNPTTLQRFKREAMTMSRLTHPNCISVIDIGISSAAPYIVMDYVTGRTLEDLLEDEERLQAGRAIYLVKQVLSALIHAHGHDMVHRDIKPDNIMVSNAEGTVDHVFVLDFGLAKFSTQGHGNITGASTLLGTPAYMSPEQTRGEQVGPESDVYSTGILLFELLSGKKPFEAENPLTTLYMHRDEPIPRLADRADDIAFSADLEHIIQTALAKAPEHRFRSADAFLSALDAVPEASTYTPPRAAKARSSSAKPIGKRQLVRDRIAFASTQPVTTLDLQQEAKKREIVARDHGTSDARVVAPASEPASLLTVPLGLPVVSQPEDGLNSEIASVVEPAAAPRTPHVDERDDDVSRRTDAPDGEGPRRVSSSELAGTAWKQNRVRIAIVTIVVIALLGAVIWLRGTSSESDADLSAKAAGTGDKESSLGTRSGAGDDAQSQPRVIARVGDIDELLDAGRNREALTGIDKLLRTTHRDNPYLLYRKGNLHFTFDEPREGIAAYRKSLAREPKYRRYASINSNLIDALADDSTRVAANSVYLNYIKRDGLRYLKKAMSQHNSPVVRKRATWLHNRITGKWK